LADHVEYAACACFVGGQSPRAVHGLRDVGDMPATPEADLVAEDPKSARPAAADGTPGDDAPLTTAEVGDWGLLDHVGPLRDVDLER
jgi:hypothetical protein